MEFSFGDSDDDFTAHDLAFHVRVGVVLAGVVVEGLSVATWRARLWRATPLLSDPGWEHI